MGLDATRCDQCRAEGHQPKPLTIADHDVEWDGTSYPSRRLNRPADIPTARYHELLRAILGPVAGRQAARAASEEAA
jgi:hypothetical protein